MNIQNYSPEKGPTIVYEDLFGETDLPGNKETDFEVSEDDRAKYKYYEYFSRYDVQIETLIEIMAQNISLNNMEMTTFEISNLVKEYDLFSLFELAHESDNYDYLHKKVLGGVAKFMHEKYRGRQFDHVDDKRRIEFKLKKSLYKWMRSSPEPLPEPEILDPEPQGASHAGIVQQMQRLRLHERLCALERKLFIK